MRLNFKFVSRFIISTILSASLSEVTKELIFSKSAWANNFVFKAGIEK